MNTAIFLVTHRCNQNCKFCLNRWDKGKDMGFAEIKKGMDKLKKLGIEQIVITGGEPFAKEDLVRIIEYGSALGFSMQVQTNGLLITDIILDKLKDKIGQIQISIEGTEETHNKLTGTEFFRKVVRNAKLVREKGIKLTTNFTITQINKDNLEEYCDILEELGVSEANFTRLYKSGKGKKNYELLKLSKEELRRFLRNLEKIEKKKKYRINLRGSIPRSFLRKEGIRLRNTYVCVPNREFAIQPDGKITKCPSDNTVICKIQDETATIAKELDEAYEKQCKLPEGCSVCFEQGFDPYSIET